MAIALAKPLTPVRDITSGYFLVRRKSIESVELDPIGFKIGLEVIAKAHYRRAIEVPYVFTDRVAGTSKLNQNEIGNYLRQLVRIYRGRLVGTQLNADAGLAADSPRETQPAEDAAQWTKCPKCGDDAVPARAGRGAFVCTNCGQSFSHARIRSHGMLIDADFVEIGADWARRSAELDR